MSKGGAWEETVGDEYRRKHKRETYDALTVIRRQKNETV